MRITQGMVLLKIKQVPNARIIRLVGENVLASAGLVGRLKKSDSLTNIRNNESFEIGGKLDNQEMTMEHRRNLLQREIVKYVNQGYQVQSSTDTQVVMSKKKKIRLITHILIALLTAGIWLIVPLIQIINRKQNTIVLSVDQFGNIRKD